VEKALTYAYRDRRVRKREFRRLWITRISAAAKACGMSYSQLMNGLRLAQVDLNRKSLAELGARDFESFKSVVSVAKVALESNA
jgi:large subunit ribosomal protein L20